jgi:myo-inositol catabolism protein IolC
LHVHGGSLVRHAILAAVALGYDKDLYLLAFDHRSAFAKSLFGITGREPSAEEAERISQCKRIIFEGLALAVEEGAPREAAGLLVDEQYGADVARDGRERGLVLAMPVERSGQDEFQFEYGDDFGAHIEEFDPAFAKVLVRYNPEGDRELNRRQTERLAVLSEWLRERGRKFLFELLVPAEAAQLESVGGDADRYDREVRPRLMAETIRELQEGGVEPDVWKIEGLDSREDCRRIAAVARSGGRDGVVCVVLGRGASDEAVEHWLRQGAAVPGYIGFAIGRTIWNGALEALLAGESERDAAVGRIAEKYRHMVDVYESARAIPASR